MAEELTDQWMRRFPLIYQTATVPLQTTGDTTRLSPSTASAEPQVTATHHNTARKKNPKKTKQTGAAHSLKCKQHIPHAGVFGQRPEHRITQSKKH